MKVAILGYGIEGKASYAYWHAKGDEVVIVDQKKAVDGLPASAKTLLGSHALKQLADFDLVVRTPQLRPDKITTNGKIWSATNEFFVRCPAPIIGVTGTKGKGTTSTLIAEILEAAGKTVHLVGNIGVPALEVLPKINKSDIVVFELSSFQLWDLERSPQTAVVLMIEPDHMDVHASMEEYIAAKANIGTYQSKDDVIIYHPTNNYSAQIAAQSPAQKKRYQTDEGAYVVIPAQAGIQKTNTIPDQVWDDKVEWVVVNDQPICKVAEVGLLGAHNIENICAAITAAWIYTQDISAVKQAITQFKGLPHRLEFVRELDGVKYYNDSFSSAPGATIAAVKSFDEPVTLIVGGYEKNADFSKLAKVVANSPHVEHVLLIGQTGPRIGQDFAEAGCQNYRVFYTKDFKEIINQAKLDTKPGGVVLLSPGNASFDMFKNFYERGEQFKQIVQDLV